MKRSLEALLGSSRLYLNGYILLLVDAPLIIFDRKSHLAISICSMKLLIYLILLKKRTAMVSAIEAHDVGCPDLAAEVDSTE